MHVLIKEGDVYKAFELKENSMPLPLSTLGQQQLINEGTFAIDGRNFKFKRYIDKGDVVVVVKCDLLKWKAPITWDGEWIVKVKDTDETDPDEEEYQDADYIELQDVYFRNIHLIFTLKKNGQRKAHLCQNDKVVRFTNISSEGLICTGDDFNALNHLEDNKLLSAKSMVQSIEEAEGNADWLETDFSLAPEDDKVILNPYVYGDADLELKQKAEWVK